MQTSATERQEGGGGLGVSLRLPVTKGLLGSGDTESYATADLHRCPEAFAAHKDQEGPGHKATDRKGISHPS